MAADTFPHIRAAAIDQRTENIFYRQTQLERLTQSLISTTNDISSAIAADYGNSQAEVAIEINLAISAVRRDYASLQPKQAHEDEYLIAAGKDAPSTRKPAGIVYIEPCTHTLFYSVIVPLSAAIAAGNCVIVLVSLPDPKHAFDRWLNQSCSLNPHSELATSQVYSVRSSHLHWTVIRSPSHPRLSKSSSFSNR